MNNIEIKQENINSNNNQKDNNILKKLLIIGSIIIVFLAVLCIVLVLDKKNNQIVKDNDDIAEVSDIKVGDIALSNFKKMYLDKGKVYTSSFNIKDITKKELIGTAVNNIDESLIGFSGQIQEEATYITANELNNVLENIIFNHDSISIEDIKSLCVTNDSKLCGDKIIQVEDNKIKVYNYPHGMSNNVGVIDKIKKVEKSGEYLYVYSNIAFRLFELTDADRMTYKYYRDYKANNFIEQIFSESSIEPNWNLYDTYKYTFKIDNSNYYFEKIELVD